MFGIILSKFDEILGPKIFLKIPHTFLNFPLDHIPFLMDLYDKGFFIHEFGVLKTANLIFNINSPISRGSKDTLMISIISYQEELEVQLSSFKEIIEDFLNKLKGIPSLYKGFHYNQISGGINAYKEIKAFTYSFYNDLFKLNILDNRNFSKKIVYELSPSGRKKLFDSIEKGLIPIKNKFESRKTEVYEKFKVKALKKKILTA